MEAATIPADHVLRGWALRETAPWRLEPASLDRATSRYASLHAEHPGFYLYRFDNSGVELLDKAAACVKPTLPDFDDRARLYLELFRQARERFDSFPALTVCLCVDDTYPLAVDVPLLHFQRPGRLRRILLPDVEFLQEDYYEAPRFQDPLGAEEKQDRAVFVGSTTGADPLTPTLLRNYDTMRLRAGRALFGHELVDFRLPRIVQYENDAVLQAMRDLPFCQTEPIDWQGQFRFRFILSIDGNGAACSRNVIVLRSRSVLLKFASRHSLLYFHGLQPWVHFVPVDEPEDVPKLVEMLGMEPDLYAAIAEAGQVFASRYLTRAALLDYTTHLLELLPSCFAEESGPASQPARPQDGVPYPGIVCRAHIEWRGDVVQGDDAWVGEPGSRKWIEGLSIDAPPALGLGYAVLDAAGVRSPTQRAGTFVGSRGEFAPLLGLAVQSAALDLALETSFVDGTRVANAPSGTMHRAPSGAPLEAFRLIRREAE